MTGGFLQDLTVNCSTAGAAGRISTALASITDRNGPNRITVTGTCGAESVTITGHDRLAIQAGVGGATINNRSLTITNSRLVTLRGLIFTATGVPNQLIQLISSSLILDGVIIQNAQFASGINVNVQSTLNFFGAPSLITGNGFNGITLSAGSRAFVSNVTISNNGSQAFGTRQSHGIFATDGSAVTLRNSLPNGADAPVDISGNSGAGIHILGGTLEAEVPTNPNALVHIHHNQGAGLELIHTQGDVRGNVKLDNNNAIPEPPFPQTQLVVGGGFVEIGGIEVQGGLGAIFNSTLFITNGTTVTGGVTIADGAVGWIVDVNSIDTLTCDATSYARLLGNPPSIGTNNCPADGPVGTGIQSITAGSGLSSTGGQTPNLSLDTGVTDARYLQLTGGTLTGSVIAPSFSGGGAALTNLTPANLSAGTAGINISGNANTATNAANAAALGGVSAANYARRDVANAFTGNQLVTGNISSTGSLSIGSGTPIAKHVSATYTTTVPSLKPNTCTNMPVAFVGAVAGSNNSIAIGVPTSLMTLGGFLMFQAFESATDTLTIRICNVSPTGPASRAGTDTIRVDLWQH